MTVNREETRSPFEIDPILLSSTPTSNARPWRMLRQNSSHLRLLDLLRSPDSKPPPPSMEKHSEIRSWMWRARAALLDPREPPPPMLPACGVFHIPCVLDQLNRSTMHRTTTNSRNTSGTCGSPDARPLDHGFVRGCRIFSTYLWCAVVSLCLLLVKSSFHRYPASQNKNRCEMARPLGLLCWANLAAPMAMGFSLLDPCVHS